MSKQDDRGGEESPNQTSVSGEKDQPSPLPSPDIVLSSFSLLLLLLTSLTDMTDHYRPIRFPATALVIE